MAAAENRSAPSTRTIANEIAATLAGIPPRHQYLQQSIDSAKERGRGDDQDSQAAAAFDQIAGPRRNGLRDRENDEAKSDQIDREDGKPHMTRRRDPQAIGEAERGNRKPDQRMPPPQGESVVEQRATKQPEHHDIAGRQRDQRRMRERNPRYRSDAGDRSVHGRAERKGDRKPPGHNLPEVAVERSRQYQKQGYGGGPQGKIEGGKRHQSGLGHGESATVILVEIIGE